MRVNVGASVGTVRARGCAAEVWLARPSEHVGAIPSLAAELLSEAERSRIERYRQVAAAARYVTTRALVRRVLGERLGVAPRILDVRVTDLGKPVVSDDLHFNVSHSGDLIVLAVSDDCAVGVDVERRRDVKRARALIARWLSPQEQRDVDELRASGLTESDAFLRVWSAKEARLKALGVGIAGATSADLAGVTAVTLDDLLAAAAPGPDDYVGAVAFA